MPKYSIPWAKNVVKEFVNDHARATNFLCKETGIRTSDLVNSLAANDGSWDVLKTLIKNIDARIHDDEYGTLIANMVARQCIKCANLPDTFKKKYLLTDYENQPRLGSGF